ncbi:hypothetical protein NONI108955_21105 [Nocardia ninae]|uniref:Uncharacterized protein n=1 Tax=Nocardia ninae NBRC 108245 TaxID=1210091 RepID=A0A511M9W9_9NOCA|nr:hypothetical protein [Nocardia ninae]GEM37453.1 hypothetical protein NN4_19720 [Nocardia ninae NBRC 108245]
MPASDPNPVADRFQREPAPAKVIGIPLADTPADGGGQPPIGELLAIAGQLLRHLDLIARRFGLRFIIDLEETR